MTDGTATRRSDARHAWASAEYVQRWIDQDVIADVLALPRAISVGLVADADAPVRRVIDLGSGPGAYLQAFLEAFPDAEGVWVDDSEPMLEEARERLDPFADRTTFVLGDAETPAELDLGPADVVATSRMVHHFPAASIRSLYAWAAETLPPGGWLFNLDHYASPEGWEPRYRRVRGELTGRRRKPGDRHPHEHPFQLVDTHLDWLVDTGFPLPDVAWKMFFTALLVARRG